MGRSKRWYFLVLLLLCGSVKAQMPPQMDSLLVFTAGKIRVNIPTGDTAAWVYELNVASMAICEKFDAYPKLDTVTLTQTVTGVTLNADFLRLAWVMKNTGDSVWVPMGSVSGDTIYLQVVDTANAKLDKKDGLQPRLYYTHGVGDTARFFTHPKFARGTIAQTFIVAYWARDAWIRPGGTINVISKYRPAIIELAIQGIKRSRGIATQQ